jgi:glycosyltransferase involved in cell wall biosynthesis
VALGLVLPTTNFDLVFFTDTEPSSKSSTWYLQLLRLTGRAGKRVAFAEHYPYPWLKNRLARLTGIDRIRLWGIEMVSFSQSLLDANRRAMNWKAVGQYIPWGLWSKIQTNKQRLQARKQLNLPADARILLVFGVLAIQRKKIDMLATTVKSMHLQQPLAVVFAGSRACDERHPFDDPELIGKSNLTIRRDEMFIDNEAVELYFAASDAVWAFYGDFVGASGVLLQSIGFGRMVIASNAGEIGDVCRRTETGILVEADNDTALESALLQFLTLRHEDQARYEASAGTAAAKLDWSVVSGQILAMLIR